MMSISQVYALGESSEFPMLQHRSGHLKGLMANPIEPN